MTKRSADLRVMLPIALIILLGFSLRIFQINRFPLRGDEAFTVIHWMREPFSQTLTNIATVDPQPPLAYAVYRAWSLIIGSQEYIVRYLPALLNVLGIPALYALGVRLGGRRAGLAAALLWAIHPFQIWHAQDARNYALWGAFSPISLWLGLRVLSSRRLIDWVLYVASAVVTCYLYYLELFPLFALNLYVFWVYRRDRGVLGRWAAAQVVIGAALAVWFLQGRLLYGSGYGGTAGSFDPVLWLTWFIPTLTFGDTQWFGWVNVLLVIFLLLAGFTVWIVNRKNLFLLFLLLVTPLLFLGLVSLRLSVFTPRYVLSVSVPIVLLVVGLFHKRRSVLQDGMKVFSFMFFVVVSLISLSIYFGFSSDYTKSPDWRTLAEYLAAHTNADDVVVQTAADEAFTFYFDEYAVSGEHLRLPANPNQTSDEIASILQNRLDSSGSIWLVAQPPPTWANGEVPHNWLNDYAQFIRQTNVNGLPALQYMNWVVQPDEINSDPLAAFDGIVTLRGARVHPTEPTGKIYVWLVWQPMRTTDRPLKVFLHLLGDTNPATGTPLWSQDDQFPQDGRLSSVDWELNTLYRDVYTLPVHDLPPGTYTLAVGWYDPETNRRLSLDGTDADTYFLQDITLP